MTKSNIYKFALCFVLICTMLLGTVRNTFAMNMEEGEVSKTEDEDTINEEETTDGDVITEGEETADRDVITEGEETTDQEKKPEKEEMPEADEPDSAEEEALLTEDDLTLSFTGEDYTVTVICGPEASLPENTALYVYEYEKDSKVYRSRYKEAAAFYGCDGTQDELGDVRLFSVGLYVNGETDEAGEPADPAAPVQVEITCETEGPEDEAAGRQYVLLHFGEQSEMTKPAVTTDGESIHAEFDADGFSDIMLLSYTNARPVAFCWSNENNLALNNSGSLYTGGCNGGGRQEVNLEWVADGRYVTVNLPADSDMRDYNWFHVYGGQGIQLSSIDKNYDYKLVGWYNLGDGTYYDVTGSGSHTAYIDLNKNNVFYADYIADSYDAGSSRDNDVIESLPTDFVSINLFDYNELINLYSTTVTEETGKGEENSGNSGEVFRDSGNFFRTPAYLGVTPSAVSGISSFAFKYNYIARSDEGDTDCQSGIFYPFGLKDWNEWTSGYNLKDAAGTWGITSSDYTKNALLNLLFNPDDKDALGVHYIGSANNLFQYGTNENRDKYPGYDFNGYYYYSSELNAAAYNQTDERFYLYDKTEKYYESDGETTDYSMFLPFNSYADYQKNGQGTNDLNVNYFFGMDMQVQFYLPNGVQANHQQGVNNKDEKGNDLIFNFSGDDDILVFCDDQLVMDMSGIHLEAHGSINFNTGTVTRTNGVNNETRTTYFSLPAGEHVLTVYYLERGTGYSNLTVSFNITPYWMYEAGDTQTVSARKVWLDQNGTELSGEETADCPDVVFGLYKEEDGQYVLVDKQTLSYDADADYIDPSTGKRILSYGWYYIWEMLDPDGKYYVQELDDNDLYTRKSETTEEKDGAYYWTIIGGSEVEGMIRTAADQGGTIQSGVTVGQVLLTDAAQNRDPAYTGSSGGSGVVIVQNGTSLSLSDVSFSQYADVSPVQEGERTVYWGTYGVIGANEIDRLSYPAVFSVETTGETVDDIGGTTLHLFRLYYEAGSVKYYLSENKSGGALTVTTNVNDAAMFYDDALGELRVHLSGDESGDYRVYIENNQIKVGETDTMTDDLENVKLYILSDDVGTSFLYTAVNQLNPDITVKKTEAGNDQKLLSGAGFLLGRTVDGVTSYYRYDEETGCPDWVTDRSEADVLLTGEDGKAVFHYLADGGYLLEEVTAPSGYIRLLGTITFTVSDGRIDPESILADGQESTFVSAENNAGEGIVITVRNETVAQLPNAGGFGVWYFVLTGLALMSAALLALHGRRRF